MRILLATDGSSFSDEAVNEIATRPWPEGSEVKIISVVEPPLLPMVETWVPPDNYIEALEQAGEEQARSIVGKAADLINKGQGDKLRVTTEIVKGHPKHGIIEAAEEWKTNLIVVGSHGYRGLTKLWLGSVSQAVAAHARCSVEIVRNPGKSVSDE